MGLKFNPLTGNFDLTGSGGSGDMTKAVYDPANIAEQLVGLTATQTLTNKTLTSPKVNENVALTTTATKLNYLTSATGTTGTASTNIVFSTSPTLVTPTLGVASATSLATSAASPLLLTNGQLVTVALTSQTVGGTTLTIPDFASVADEFTFKTKAQTMSNKTFVAPALGTPASGTLTNCTGYTDANLSTSDITTNDSSTSKHGFLKKLDNNAAHYMDGTGAWSTPSAGSAISILAGGGTGTAATRFFPVQSSLAENATESNVMVFRMPYAATLSNLYAGVVVAPGASKSWTITVRTDEAVAGTMADTTLTCSIADANIIAADTTHTPTVSAGKYVTVAMTRVSTASAPTGFSFSFQVTKT